MSESVRTPTPPSRSPAGDRKRAALIATAITLPVVVVLALLLGTLGGGSSDAGPQNGPLPAISAAIPPQVTEQAKPCTALLEQLPVELTSLPPRVVDTPAPTTPFVIAWGNPAIVLRCGVAKPGDIKPGSDAQFYSINGNAGAFYDVQMHGDVYVFTTVDRTAYVSIDIPTKYQPATVVGVLNPLILKAMPTAVCSSDSATEPDPDKLCSRRSR